MQRLKLRKSMSGLSSGERNSPSTGRDDASGSRGGSARRLATTSASGISEASSDASSGLSGPEARAALLAFREKSIERSETTPVALGRSSIGPCSGAEGRAALMAQRALSTPVPVQEVSAVERSLCRVSGSPSRSAGPRHSVATNVGPGVSSSGSQGLASHALPTTGPSRISPSSSRETSATHKEDVELLIRELTWTTNAQNISKLESILAHRTRQASEFNLRVKEYVNQVGIRVHSVNGTSKSGTGAIKVEGADPTTTRMNLAQADAMIRLYQRALKEKSKAEALLAARDDPHLFAYLHQKLYAQENA